MLVSIVITILLLYVAFNTKMNGTALPKWTYFCIVLLGLTCWLSAVVVLCICAYCLYNGVKSGEIDTVDWIEDLIKHV